MILQKKTLEMLRELINEETEYRKGFELVEFFNDLGFNDVYEQGFPSRWIYTDSKLKEINGKPELDKCIKKVFAPVNFVRRFSELDKYIHQFNQYLAFDGWKIIREGKNITFAKTDQIDFEDDRPGAEENEFLKRELSDISIDQIGLDGVITNVIQRRFDEIKQCFAAKAFLSVIILSGSTLEGILFGIANNNMKEFNQSKAAPKNQKGKVKLFQDWTLNNLIDVSADLGFLEEDVKKFSHSLRQFRNYIHPYEQMVSRFNPSEHTSKICLQVLKAAIFQIVEKTK